MGITQAQFRDINPCETLHIVRDYPFPLAHSPVIHLPPNLPLGLKTVGIAWFPGDNTETWYHRIRGYYSIVLDPYTVFYNRKFTNLHVRSNRDIRADVSCFYYSIVSNIDMVTQFHGQILKYSTR